MQELDPYVAWLRRTMAPLFQAGGTWWRPYHMALVQASAKPEPVDIGAREAMEVLKESGTLFLRYFTRTFEQPTGFWYVACDKYNVDNLAKKTRYYVRRGSHSCTVQRVDAAWLAIKGYKCYLAAFERYTNAHPVPQTEFAQDLMGSVGGPFDFWAVIHEGKLITYCKCVVGKDYIATFVLKTDPQYLCFYPVYALMDAMLKTYSAEEHKQVTYGFRSIAHDTNIQAFLEKFGFRRVYCDLKVVYRPAVRTVVSLCMPFKSALDRLPTTNLTSQLKSVLTQEQIRRSFL